LSKRRKRWHCGRQGGAAYEIPAGQGQGNLQLAASIEP
jgi:hypothetical protein